MERLRGGLSAHERDTLLASLSRLLTLSAELDAALAARRNDIVPRLMAETVSLRRRVNQLKRWRTRGSA